MHTLAAISDALPHLPTAAGDITDTWGPRQYVGSIIGFLVFVVLSFAGIKVMTKADKGDVNKAAKSAGVSVIGIVIIAMGLGFLLIITFATGVLTSITTGS